MKFTYTYKNVHVQYYNKNCIDIELFIYKQTQIRQTKNIIIKITLNMHEKGDESLIVIEYGDGTRTGSCFIALEKFW